MDAYSPYPRFYGVIMRVIINLHDHQITELDALAEAERAPRTELARRAVAEFLDRNRRPEADAAFGLWKGRCEGGAAYQDRLRSEWEDGPCVRAPYPL